MGSGGVEVVVVVSGAHVKGKGWGWRVGKAGPTYKTKQWGSVLMNSMWGRGGGVSFQWGGPLGAGYGEVEEVVVVAKHMMEGGSFGPSHKTKQWGLVWMNDMREGASF